MKKLIRNFIFISFIIILLIFIQMLFYKDFALESCRVINGLYITSSFGVMVYGFITSRYYILNQLSFGYTRKEIYFDFLKRIGIVLVYIILVNLVYLLFDLIINNHNGFKDFLSFRKLIYFIACFLLFASSGFFQGIFKLKGWIALIVMVILSTLLILIEALGIVSFAIIIPIMVLSIILFFVNSKLIYKINILN